MDSITTVVSAPPAEEEAALAAVADLSIADNTPDDDCGDEEEIDESDPLWQAVIKITNGDRKKALEMIEDPDELSKYPEIEALLAPGGDEEWEAAATAVSSDPAAEAPITATPASEAESDVAKTSGSTKKATVTDFEEDIEDEDDGDCADEDPRQHLNLVFIGHVDAGKSTLSGSILYIMGQVDARTIERYERDAKQRNRESWFLAFIMDTSEEERAKGKTVEVGRAHFETDQSRYTILDAPGHKNYVPNMIQGATQADVGILVISARKGEFETGFEKGGQTREHALLAKTLGVRFLVVVINKMDDPTVNWSQERYDECVMKLKPFLKICGYAIKRDVRFIPISGLSGDNIKNEVAPDRCSWWRGYVESEANNTATPTLLNCLDGLHISGRDPAAPLRIPCLDRYFERGVNVMGKIESGTLRLDDEVAILPTRKKAKVEAIYIDEKKVRSAKPGENVLLKLNLNLEDLQKGFVLSSPESPCQTAVRFRAHLLFVDLLDHRPIVSRGYDCVMHLHTAEVEVTIIAVESVTDSRGVVMRQPFVRQGQYCVAVLSTPLQTCMEPYDVMPSLGRLTLRDEGKTIAIGKVTDVLR